VPKRSLRVPGALAIIAIVAAACQAGASPSPTFTLPTSVGEGEGALTVLAWPGYAEDGTTDPAVDWITPFEQETGCQTTVQTFDTSDEAFTIYSTNPEQYDVVSASGDASNRLVAGGYVQPVNVDLVPSYPEIFADLKDKPYNTFDGVHYGIPHGRGANLLMWNTDEVDPAPTSWTDMFDPNSPYAGKFSVYDAPIYIADAAVVLMKTKPELGITNPYALDETQLQAAVDLLKAQKPAVGEYWTAYTKQIDSFTNGNTVLGTTWQIIAYLLQGATTPVPVEAIKPDEGATGWSDTWMINSKTDHINCAYKFLNHITSAPVNAQIAEWFGEAPGNSKSCELTTDPEHCANFHADDPAYWTNIYYWTTPVQECLDGRTDVQCTTFDDWVKAWQEIRS
jgi:putative spermidine/putrescine transport system substrate-binding protein